MDLTSNLHDLIATNLKSNEFQRALDVIGGLQINKQQRQGMVLRLRRLSEENSLASELTNNASLAGYYVTVAHTCMEAANVIEANVKDTIGNVIDKHIVISEEVSELIDSLNNGIDEDLIPEERLAALKNSLANPRLDPNSRDVVSAAIEDLMEKEA